MFHSVKLQEVDYISNPPLDPEPVVVLDTREDGSPINSFQLREIDHSKSLGHYDPSTMSLRALVNMGFVLRPVSFGITDNDPNSVTRKARNVINQIDFSVNSRHASSVQVETPKSE